MCVVCKLCYDWLTGTTVFAEIQGVVEACVKLSGMPDLTLSFMVGPHTHTLYQGWGPFELKVVISGSDLTF